MLCVNNGSQAYVDECQSKIEAQFAAYRALIATVGGRAAKNEPRLNAAIEAF